MVLRYRIRCYDVWQLQCNKNIGLPSSSKPFQSGATARKFHFKVYGMVKNVKNGEEWKKNREKGSTTIHCYMLSHKCIPVFKTTTRKKHEDIINRTIIQVVLHRGTAEDMQTLRLQQTSDTDLNRLCQNARDWDWGHVGFGVFGFWLCKKEL